MKPSIIREHVMRLHLDPHAPYPHELLRDEAKAQEVRDEIRKFRESQGLQLVPRTADDEPEPQELE